MATSAPFTPPGKILRALPRLIVHPAFTRWLHASRMQLEDLKPGLPLTGLTSAAILAPAKVERMPTGRCSLANASVGGVALVDNVLAAGFQPTGTNPKTGPIPVKLKRLTLKNFRCFENLALDFDEYLTVLVAENGAGKTTLLDATALA